MVSVPRYRTRAYGPWNTGGTKDIYSYWNGSPTPYYTRHEDCTSWSEGRGYEETDDFLTISGTRADHDFESFKVYGKRRRLNGQLDIVTSSKNHHYIYDEWCPYSGSGLGSAQLLPQIPLETYWSNAILKGLNTQAPVVDVPLFLFELKDFPRMLRDFGRVLRREVDISTIPNGFLAYRFGWAPMVNDAISLLNLSEEIRKRLEFLRKVQRGERIRRVLADEEDIYYGQKRTEELCIKCQNIERTRVTTWYTARLRVTDQATLDDLELMYVRARSGPDASEINQVLRALLGIKVSGRSASTVWNAIPWSWLIDYFASVGDFIEAKSGLLPYKPYDVNIMEQLKRDMSWEFESHVEHKGYVSVSDTVRYTPDKRTILRRRREAAGSIQANVHLKPFLSGSQTAILSALALSRLLKTT